MQPYQTSVFSTALRIVIISLLLTLCVFEFFFQIHSDMFSYFERSLLSQPLLLLFCITFWNGIFIVGTFRLCDFSLIAFLSIALFVYFFSGPAETKTDAFVLFGSICIAKAVRFLLQKSFQQSAILPALLIAQIAILSFASVCHLNIPDNFYHGPRWMGLWDNPNNFGMLMSACLLLAIGLIISTYHDDKCFGRSQLFYKALYIGLLIAATTMAFGLLCSFSRGAWTGAIVGFLYLVKGYQKTISKYALAFVLITFTVSLLFWGKTRDSDPWYIKRFDFGRASAQHRVSAWTAAVQMVGDHPFGVGWNKAEEVYARDYSPPENGAAAIKTNSFFMLGTESGVLGLMFFIIYSGLSFERIYRCVNFDRLKQMDMPKLRIHKLIATAHTCHAGALSMFVAFWFDGGLFTFSTACMFWTLLELGNMVSWSVAFFNSGKNEKVYFFLA